MVRLNMGLDRICEKVLRLVKKHSHSWREEKLKAEEF